MEPTTPLLPARASHSADDDASMVARSVAQPAAFDAVYRRHASAIFVFVSARVGPVAAEDVVAEVFTTAFRARDKFDPSATSARPWLYGIAVNKLRQHRDAERRWLEQPRTESDDSLPMSDSADERVDARDLVPDLAAALATLTAAERDVLVLHVFEELTHREIADVLGIRRGTAKVRLHRGCQRLRQVLAERGESE